MLKALADEHVHPGLVAGLRRRNMDVVTVQELGLDGTDDFELLTLAYREQRVMLTSDTDFLALAMQCRSSSEPFAPIFYWPQQQRTIGEVLRAIIRECSHDDFESLLSKVLYL